MRKKPVRKLLAACIAGALFFPGQGFALGLGDIEVSSSLNQDLSADIKLLSAAPEDAQSLIVKLASRKEFSRAGIDRPYSLNELKFKTVIIDNVPHIKITTKQPVRAPYLNFLLEVDWPKGHLLREYTILLDPPTFMSKATPAQMAAAADNTAFRPSPSSNKPVSSAPLSASVIPAAGFRPQSSQTGATSAHAVKQNAAVALQAGSRGHQSSGKYRVQRGDTAWSLADSMRPDRSVTVEQMMIALLRANPDSFNHKNINGLKRGYILRIPDAKAIAAISPMQAQALVHKQTALWQQYRREYAGGQPVSTVANPVTNLPGKNATAKNAAGNVTNTPVKEKGAHLQIVSAGAGASTSSTENPSTENPSTKNPAQMNASELRETLSLAREQLESERVEKESLQQKVDQLEHQVSKMKGVLPIEDNNLAQAQTLAEKASSATAKTATESTGKEAENLVTKAKATENKPATASTATVSTTTQPQPAQRPVSGMKHRQMGPLAQLLNNPMLLAAAGSGLLLLLALIYLVIKRRKTTVEETETSVAEAETGDLEDVADMVEEDQHEDDTKTDTDSESTLVMDAEETDEEDTAEEAEAMAKAKAEEIRDDVIAEADTYLAYGIYQQAEDLLENAIKEHPQRDDYRVKLAETHYASKNKEAFIDTAKQLRQNSGDDTPAWKKVLVMGQDLCVDDPLFQGSLVGGLDVDSLPSKAPGMDFDLGMEVDDETSSNENVGLDEPLDLPDVAEDTELDSMTSNGEETAMNMAEEPDAQASDSSMDELEFDLSETAAVAEEKTEESVLDEDFSMDIDAAELDIDEDHSAAETKTEADTDDDIVLDLSDDGVLDEMELGADTEPGVDEVDVPVQTDDTSSDQQNEIKVDDVTDEAISEIDESADLNLESEIDESADLAVDIEADQSDEEEFDLSSLDDVDEISTKLDLARAYLDMGDHEGTKEILEEVLTDGNDEQKREANELMSQLDS